VGRGRVLGLPQAVPPADTLDALSTRLLGEPLVRVRPRVNHCVRRAGERLYVIAYNKDERHTGAFLQQSQLAEVERELPALALTITARGKVAATRGIPGQAEQVAPGTIACPLPATDWVVVELTLGGRGGRPTPPGGRRALSTEYTPTDRGSDARRTHEREPARGPRRCPVAELTIRDVRAILTSPGQGNIQQRLIVVKVETSEPGLHGLGCATFTQRHHAVRVVIDEFLRPLLTGRNPQQIEDLWQTIHVNAYWRSGPVLNNALSGVDMALWDIKGKRAGMPVYELLGGKCREGATVYRHAAGSSPEEVEESVRRLADAREAR